MDGDNRNATIQLNDLNERKKCESNLEHCSHADK